MNIINIHNFTVLSGGSRIFPRGGREPSRGGVNTPNFPENCMKSKEFGRPGGGGGRASLTPPLDPPMVLNKPQINYIHGERFPLAVSYFLTFVVICLVIISERPPLSHRLL